MGWAKKFPWYTHRLMHQKRVTCELHDSYFRLRTIKHAISNIKWALSLSPSGVAVELKIGRSWSRDVVRKVTPGRRGPWEALMNWGPEKMLIRCSKGSHHPAESTPASGEQERHNVMAKRVGVKILQFMFGFQLPLTVEPHTTLLNLTNKMRGKYC